MSAHDDDNANGQGKPPVDEVDPSLGQDPQLGEQKSNASSAGSEKKPTTIGSNCGGHTSYPLKTLTIVKGNFSSDWSQELEIVTPTPLTRR